jgi:hypothetical protein
MLATMPVCPFCQTDLAMPNLPCPSCGKRMADHPSLAEGKSYSVKPAARTSGALEAVRSRPAPASPAFAPPGGEVPELELSSRHAPKPRPASPAEGGSANKAPSLPPLAKKPSLAGARSTQSSSQRGATADGPAKTESPGSSGRPMMIPGVGGAVFDEDDIFAPGGEGAGPLELDTAGPGIASLKMPAVAPPAPAPAGRTSSGASAPAAGALVPHREGSPAGGRDGALSPRLRGAEADGDEAAALADYGDTPDSWWQAPLYAYRVKTRQAEIRRLLAEREADLARVRQSEEEARITFADRARAAAHKFEVYAQPLAAIANAEQLMLQRDGVLTAEVEAHNARLAVIDERIAGLDGELAQMKAEERQIEEKLNDAEAIRQRADAKLKRAEIEIRNASALVDAASTAGRDAAKKAGLP